MLPLFADQFAACNKLPQVAANATLHNLPKTLMVLVYHGLLFPIFNSESGRHRPEVL